MQHCFTVTTDTCDSTPESRTPDFRDQKLAELSQRFLDLRRQMVIAAKDVCDEWTRLFGHLLNNDSCEYGTLSSVGLNEHLLPTVQKHTERGWRSLVIVYCAGQIVLAPVYELDIGNEPEIYHAARRLVRASEEV